MTMLDRMRRHKAWLKWSLGLVVLTFIIFYIPDFLRGKSGNGGALPSDVLARVNDTGVSVLEFRQAYQRQVAAYRSAYGSNVSEQLLKQLGFEQQVLQRLINEQAMIAEASRLGISVTDEDVRQRILAMPEFQVNGQFIGEERYRGMLNTARPPMTPSEFEASLRRQLLVEKLRAVVTDWMTVTDAEADREYTKRNEKVKVQLVAFSAATFISQASATDADVSSYFDSHKDKYRVGERRKVRYVLVDLDAVRKGVTVPSREIERYYNNNIELFSTPEQVRASHILFKTDGKNDTAVQAEAEKVLADAVKPGADFAELAKKHSQDESNAKLGGDLDYFGRGRMVPEFDQAVFGAEPGVIPTLVKTSFGLHIIKVVDKKAAVTRTLDEVRPQITEQLAGERAQKQVETLADEVAKQITKPADLDTVAKARGWKVEETGFFTVDEPMLAIGGSPQVSAQIFGLKDGEVSQPLRVGRGVVFATLAGRQEPALPKFDDVKTKVREDLLKEKASALAAEKAKSVGAALKTAPDFAAAAKKAGLEAKSSDFVARGGALPEVGVNPTIEQAVFAMPAGATSDPIQTLDTTAIVKVVERQHVTPEEVAKAREATRQELISERRDQFFTAYMVKARQKMKIELNREVLDRTLGS
jgi:peptidyl-prolyl cis-trans isomerase D